VAVDAITTRTAVTATSVVGIIRFLMQTLLRDAGSPAAAGTAGIIPNPAAPFKARLLRSSAPCDTTTRA
jgi:hypothetical protein